MAALVERCMRECYMELERVSAVARAREAWEETGSTGPVWVCDPDRTVMGIGLANNLSEEVQVHFGWSRPQTTARPKSVVVCSASMEQLLEGISHVRLREREACILVFTPFLDLPLAWSALQLGARGYLHSGMRPDQILRAVSVAEGGEVVAPRKLLEYVVENAACHHAVLLSARRREVLGLAADGMTNAQIARKLYLSESTVKQHLYAAYKLLGVRNRTEAASLVRGGGVPGVGSAYPEAFGSPISASSSVFATPAGGGLE